MDVKKPEQTLGTRVIAWASVLSGWSLICVWGFLLLYGILFAIRGSQQPAGPGWGAGAGVMAMMIVLAVFAGLTVVMLGVGVGLLHVGSRIANGRDFRRVVWVYAGVVFSLLWILVVVAAVTFL